MSRSDWSKHTKAGVIAGFICAAVLTTLFIGWGLLESAKYQKEADYQASEHSKYTSDKVAQACVGFAPAKRFECVGDAIVAQRDTERNEQDLVAQRQSALWAYIMGAAAVIGMGLSSIGVILVFTTFRETRRTAKIAKDALEHEIANAKAVNRPWLSIDDPEIEIEASEQGETVLVQIRIRAKVRNNGNSPALNVQEFSDKTLDLETLAEWEMEFFDECLGILRSGGRNIAPGSSYTFLFDAAFETTERAMPIPFLYLAFTYQMTHEEAPPRITSQSYEIFKKAQAMGGIGFSVREVIDASRPTENGLRTGLKAEVCPWMSARMT